MKQLMLFGAGAGAFYEMRQGLPLAAARLTQGIVLPAGADTFLNHRGISISPDQRRAVVFSMNGGYKAYSDTRDFGSTEDAVSISNVVAAFALDDCYIVCGDTPFLVIKEWDDGAMRSIDTTGLGRVYDACLSPDRSRLFLAHTNNKLRAYDLATGDYVDAQNTYGDYGWNNAYNQRSSAFCCTKSGEYLLKYKVWYYISEYIGIHDTATLEKTSQTVANLGVGKGATQAVPHPHEEDSVIINLGDTSGGLLVINCRENTRQTYLTGTAALQDWFPGQTAVTTSYFAYDEEEDEFILLANAGTDYKMLALDARTFAIKREIYLGEEGGKANRFFTASMLCAAIIKRDNYQITGTVRASNNAPCARVVRAFRRSNGALAAQTMSDHATGDYRLLLPDAGPYDVQFQALDSEELNDLFFARTEPEPVTA